jgi:hypothetical protein
VAAPSIERIPEITTEEVAVERHLKEIWEGESGLKGYLSTVDHKELGKNRLLESSA